MFSMLLKSTNNASQPPIYIHILQPAGLGQTSTPGSINLPLKVLGSIHNVCKHPDAPTPLLNDMDLKGFGNKSNNYILCL